MWNMVAPTPQHKTQIRKENPKWPGPNFFASGFSAVGIWDRNFSKAPRVEHFALGYGSVCRKTREKSTHLFDVSIGSTYFLGRLLNDQRCGHATKVLPAGLRGRVNHTCAKNDFPCSLLKKQLQKLTGWL